MSLGNPSNLGKVSKGSYSELTLGSGSTVDEFSIDGTLSANLDSNVSTQKAVKTYVDGQLSGENHWDRTVTTIHPYNAGDDVTTTGNIECNTLTVSSDILPVTDNNTEIGSSTKRIKEMTCIDPDGAQFSIRGLASANKRIRNKTSVLTYDTTHSVTTGVWTYTITDSSGIGVLAFTIGDEVIVHSGTTLSAIITSYSGTDLNPKTIYVYVKNDGLDNPELVASNTNPEGVLEHVNVAQIKGGTVSASSVTIYADISQSLNPYEFVHNTYHRLYEEGTLYRTGLNTTSSVSDIIIGVGSIKTVFDALTTIQVQSTIDSQYYVKNDGTFNTISDFSFVEYGDGGVIGANRYFNVVVGILHYDSVTLIHALVQNDPTTEYNSTAQALEDAKQTLVTAPTDTTLKYLFVPVARVILQKTGTGVLQPLGASYHIDLRGIALGGGSSGGGGGNVLDGNVNDDFPIWNSTTGEYEPQTVAQTLTTLGLSTVDAVQHQSIQLAFGTAMNAIRDEDAMTSDSATSLCTQQSIKKYVDDQLTAGSYWNRSAGVLTPVTTTDYVQTNRVSGVTTSTNYIDLADSVYVQIQANNTNGALRVIGNVQGDAYYQANRTAGTDICAYELVDAGTRRWIFRMSEVKTSAVILNTNQWEEAISIDNTTSIVDIPEGLTTDDILESTAAHGVAIEQVTIKDGSMTLDNTTSVAINFDDTSARKFSVGITNGQSQAQFKNSSGGMMFYCDYGTTVWTDSVNDRPVHIDINGNLGTTSSLQAHKMNIQDIDDPTWIYTLRPRVFNRKEKISAGVFKESALPYTEYGFIAEEVLHDAFCDYDYIYTRNEDGTIKTSTKSDLHGIKMQQLPAVIVKEMQRRNDAISVDSVGIVSIPMTYNNEITNNVRDLAIDEDGKLGYLPSTKDSKKNINYTRDYSWVYKLKPVTFIYKKGSDTEYGLIAEDVEKINKDLCLYSKEGKLQGINYRKLTTPLIGIVKDVIDENFKLKKDIEILMQNMSKLQSDINGINTRLSLIEYKELRSS